MTGEWRPPLDHEVHPYTPKPDGGRFCICGLWPKHHLHTGVSSAGCTCLECITSREGASAAWGLSREGES